MAPVINHIHRHSIPLGILINSVVQRGIVSCGEDQAFAGQLGLIVAGLDRRNGMIFCQSPQMDSDRFRDYVDCGAGGHQGANLSFRHRTASNHENILILQVHEHREKLHRLSPFAKA